MIEVQKFLNRNKAVLTDALCLCAIVLLPWQARWIISYQTIAGQPYEYGTISVYAGSIVVILAVAGLWFSGQLPRFRPWFQVKVLAGWLLIGSILAPEPLVGIYYCSLVLFGFGYFLIARYWERMNVFMSVVLAGLLQTIIAWQQFINQHITSSTILGLAEHSPAVLGQSVISIAGKRLLRAYGMVPHPNMLGGFLVIAFAIAVYLYIQHERREQSLQTMKEWGAYMFACLFLFSGILISFSRAALLCGVVFLIAWAVYAFMKHDQLFAISLSKMLIACAGLFLAFNLIASNIWLQRFGVVARTDPQTMRQTQLDARSTSERIVAFHQAQVIATSRNVILGVGLGNYVPTLARAFSSLPVYAYQPIHNAYMLMFFEIGVFGVLFLFWLLQRTWREYKNSLKNSLNRQYIFSLILLIGTLGLFDHYLWSSYFGLSMLWLTIGLAIPVNND